MAKCADKVDWVLRPFAISAWLLLGLNCSVSAPKAKPALRMEIVAHDVGGEKFIAHFRPESHFHVVLINESRSDCRIWGLRIPTVTTR